MTKHSEVPAAFELVVARPMAGSSGRTTTAIRWILLGLAEEAER